MYVYIYIYIYIERDIYIYTYILEAIMCGKSRLGVECAQELLPEQLHIYAAREEVFGKRF